jgi:hypothetical protein
MKRLLIIGFAACAFALTPTLSASAMPAATPGAFGGSDAAVIQVKGGHRHGHGHGHMGRGGRGHHYGWGSGRGKHLEMIGVANMVFGIYVNPDGRHRPAC